MKIDASGPRAWRPPELAALALTALVFGLNVYRATSQSITHDEAFAYHRVVTWSWLDIFTLFRDCHHLLNSYLSKASVELLGLSELSLRLPSLLGGLLYLVVVLRLTRHLFASPWTVLLAVALLVLDANLLDHMSAARGYGLGMAFLSLAALEMLLVLGSPGEVGMPRERRHLLLAGVALALSVASNLTYAIPGSAFSMVFLGMLWSDAPPGQGRETIRAWFRHLMIPALATFAVTAVPLVNMRLRMFSFGSDTLAQAEQAIVAGSFWRRGGLRAVLAPERWRAFTFGAAHAFVMLVLVLTAIALASGAARRLRTGSREDAKTRPPLKTGLALMGGGLLLTIGFMVAAHTIAGIRYPEARMGVWCLPLTYLCALCLAGCAWRRTLLRATVAFPLLAFCVAALVGDLLAFDTTHYETWWYDRASRRYVELIRERRASQIGHPVRVGATWIFEPSFNFYRIRFGLAWMARLDRKGPVGRFDYYVLAGDDTVLIERLGLKEIARDNMAGSVLAEPTSAQTAATGLPGQDRHN
ncbi:MAG TPA: hypothetical protein VMK12_06720 [Anaeromyxobacteraceae bacterium]|nr:hypothetical protein [Anaeromyxobacteraceae bacterium]